MHVSSDTMRAGSVVVVVGAMKGEGNRRTSLEHRLHPRECNLLCDVCAGVLEPVEHQSGTRVRKLGRNHLLKIPCQYHANTMSIPCNERAWIGQCG